MILDFRDKRLEDFLKLGKTKGLNAAHIKKLRFILAALDEASSPDDLQMPGFRLHPLIENLKGYWAITVAANWRVIFQFKGNDVTYVDLVDYH